MKSSAFLYHSLVLTVLLSLGYASNAWAQCPYTVPPPPSATADCPIDLVQIVGKEPVTDGVLLTRVWAPSTIPAAITIGTPTPIIEALFDSTDNDGLPMLPSGTAAGETIYWPFLGINYPSDNFTSFQYTWPSNGNASNSREQAQQDGWLIIPDAVSCIPFRLSDQTEKSASFYISNNATVQGMTRLLGGQGGHGSSGDVNIWANFGPLPRIGNSNSGFRFTRIRLYHHDPSGIANSSIEWDIGNGWEAIPRKYLQSVPSFNSNANQPSEMRESESQFAYRDSNEELFEIGAGRIIGAATDFDQRYKQDTISLLSNVIIPGQCTPTFTCGTWQHIKIDRQIPAAGATVYQLEWNNSSNAFQSTAQWDYLDAFNTTTPNNYPGHDDHVNFNFDGIVPVTGLGSSDNAPPQSSTSEQYMQDAWLAVPNEIECLEFLLGDHLPRMQASALWIGRDFNSMELVAQEVRGAQTGGTYCIPPNVFQGSNGWKWIRVRLYTHNHSGSHNSTVKWDLGEGFVEIPAGFLHAAQNPTGNTPPLSTNFSTSNYVQYGIQDNLGYWWHENGTLIPNNPIDFDFPFGLEAEITPLTTCNLQPIHYTGSSCSIVRSADPCNLSPTATPDTTVAIQGGITLYADALDNDDDPNDSDTAFLMITFVSNGNNGTASVQNNIITYSHNGTTLENDTIYYHVCDDDPVDQRCDTTYIIFEIDKDTDGDLVADIADIDDDNDGILDVIEDSTALFGGDSDQDGIADRFDLDSDNDGIPDIVEAGGADPDSDGLVAPIVPFPSNGWNQGAGAGYLDSDGDGRPNSTDLDSDNDALYDMWEAGYLDPNLNGFHDVIADPDSIGWDTIVRLDGQRNLDNDSIPARLDLDSDNDGIPNVRERNIPDVDFDGRVEVQPSDSDGVAQNLIISSSQNSDGDIYPDFLDSDSDDDGIPDVVEGGINHGTLLGVVATVIADTNSDGWDDGNNLLGMEDDDGDGIFDQLDLDSDNDGLWDYHEAGGRDTISDGLTPGTDTDGDGWRDLEQFIGNQNSDGDNFPDRNDLDSDNDGIADISENHLSDTIFDGRIDLFADTSGNGADDNRMRSFLVNSDLDSLPDCQDLDADNDGLPDIWEAWGNAASTGDVDSDGIVDNTIGNYGWSASDKIIDSLDSDEDRILDRIDLDSDNDGFFDLHESIAFGPDTLMDVNGDGQIDNIGSTNGWENVIDSTNLISNHDTDPFPDHLDLDSDNDGICDLFEQTFDPAIAFIGTLSPISDPDSNGTDATGMVASAWDLDGDTLPNHLDLDSEQDGVPDIREYKGTEDIPTGMVLYSSGADPNNDGWIDNPIDPLANFDGDPFPNQNDLDSDNDGIPDLKESGGSGLFSLGIVDTSITDTDGNGWDDDFANIQPANHDNDLLPDFLDLDSDNDGIWDILEGGGTSHDSGVVLTPVDVMPADGWDDVVRLTDTMDFDGDLFEDRIDLDSDNDGLSDLSEAGGIDTLVFDGFIDDSTDIGNDGAYDFGMIDIPRNTDAPLDGQPDHLDLDSDQDGLADLWEAMGTDLGGDGQVDAPVDSNSFGWVQRTPDLLDSDRDGIVDRRDLDSDNDGFYDLYESIGFNPAINNRDTSEDGRIDNVNSLSGWESLLQNQSNIVDTDMDLIFDFQDLDSDNDGLADLFEEREDIQHFFTGMHPATGDGNGDGADDNDMIIAPKDSDGDLFLNHLDLDSDQDGIPDIRETSGKESGRRGKWVYDPFEDQDKNGWLDSVTLSVIDADSDGFFNHVDLDSDNDGIPDVVEGGDTSQIAGTYNPLNNSLNGWFPFDSTLGRISTDSDTIPDYLDLDSDNDGIWDIFEAGTDTVTNQGRVQNFNPDTLGWDMDERSTGKLDSDQDFFPDRLDLDSDNDGISDLEENGRQFQQSGEIQSGNDSDGDGADDGLTNRPPLDSDGDLVRNFRDLDSDNDLIPDILETTGRDELLNGTVDTLGGISVAGWATSYQKTWKDDLDGDSIPNRLDLDSDQDHMFDLHENMAFDDTLRFLDPDTIGRISPTNIPSNGWLDELSAKTNSDNDSIPDFQDLDSDNDGLADAYENGLSTNAHADVLAPITDQNGDGADDHSMIPWGEIEDLDGDMVFNHLDLDSDQDGVPDVLEAGISEDHYENSGRVREDLIDDETGWMFSPPTEPWNTDQDNHPDHWDLDSDNDGIPDVIEASGFYPNPDGVIASNNFSDSLIVDGWDDSLGILVPLNSDLDMVPDMFDTESDGDGILDFIESRIDADPDNVDSAGRILNFTDLNQGWDYLQGSFDPLNSDGDDAIPDYRELDSDGDGMPDSLEYISGFGLGALPGCGPFMDTLAHQDGKLCRVKFYEGFSPNGDAFNEKFIVDGIYYSINPNNLDTLRFLTDVIKNEILIFNRWGDIVFQDEDWLGEWDGSCNQGPCNGGKVPDGVYFYVFRYEDPKRDPEKGYIYVVR